MHDLNTFRLIERISTLLRSEQHEKYAAIGLQPVHAQILEFLSKCNRHTDTPAAVSEYLGLPKKAMLQALQILEHEGYITQIQDIKDRRVVHLSLLAAGMKLVDEIRPLDVFSQAEQLVGTQNFSSLDEALHAALNALQTANHSRSFGLCHSCTHFSEIDNHYHCQLTNLPLTQADTHKICQEHSPRFDT